MVSMTHALQAEIIGIRHNFSSISSNIPLTKKRRLSDDDFKFNPQNQSLEFEKVVTF